MRSDSEITYIAVMGTPDEKAMGIIKEMRISDDKTSLTKRYMVSVSLLKESIMNVKIGRASCRERG